MTQSNCLVPVPLPPPRSTIPAIFVSHASYLKNSPGGVQLCTQEYIKTLEAAGFELVFLSYTTETNPLVRLKRKVFANPYCNHLPLTLATQIIALAQTHQIQHIFLNQVDTAPVAQTLKAALGKDCHLTLLSHGLDSTDRFHMIRSRQLGQPFHRVTAKERDGIAQSLIAECQQRQFIDHVFCLSDFETNLERWLGAKQVTWLPRTIPQQPLSWQPNPNYLGFVGTVGHIPNLEGLLLFLEALQAIAPPTLRLRLVGGPEAEAKRIAHQFPLVDYLGSLSDADLRAEASTWSCFVHPLFCYARGCSTKLAIALGWQIPVITTPPGCRGYRWQRGTLPLADTPAALAELALTMLHPDVARQAQAEIQSIASSAPTLADIAAIVQAHTVLITEVSRSC